MSHGPEGLEADFTVRRGDFTLTLSLSLPRGRTVALLGPNGAGKSTAVAALAGLLPIDSGRIELGGRCLDAPEAGVLVPAEERRVGIVFQDALLFPHLTALENVAFGLRSRGTRRTEARSRARGWLARVGLDGLEERTPDALSGGQAQRVALARTLATEPELLLLDEPLSALDVTARSELRRVLDEHLETVAGPRLLITHDPTEAFRLADEIHLLEAGRVTQTGTADDIRMRPRTRYAAELVGTNLIRGIARDGVVETGSSTLRIADEEIRGPVRLTLRPNAVSVHLSRPAGSPRNTWRTGVERVEEFDTRVRILTGAPLPLVVEVTRNASAELKLAPGVEVWLAVKATEVGVEAEAARSSQSGVLTKG